MWSIKKTVFPLRIKRQAKSSFLGMLKSHINDMRLHFVRLAWCRFRSPQLYYHNALFTLMCLTDMPEQTV